MREQLERRLGELKAEYQAGQKMLADLEAKQANLQQTLLRISGAIQVLEEELAASAPADPIEPGAAVGTAIPLDSARHLKRV
jgi:predicted nuclease with TOPRIM domain